MKKITGWLLIAILVNLAAGCRYHRIVIDWVEDTPVPYNPPALDLPSPAYPRPDAYPLPWQVEPGGQAGSPPRAIATLPLPIPTLPPTPFVPPDDRVPPTPLPDYTPGRGLAILQGPGPYQLSLSPGGWQAYQIGPSADPWAYAVDVTPLAPAFAGAYVESKILPEYNGSAWMDVLWLRAPGILDALPVEVALLPTQGWTAAYQADVTLQPGDWMGFGMFSTTEGCGGILDVSITDPTPSPAGTFIFNTRVQPEFPGEWIQVARVQLSSQGLPQPAHLAYYTPREQASELLRMETVLFPGEWYGRFVGASRALRAYVVEVVPQEKKDNEVAFALVRPEYNGRTWQDVLRIYIPDGRPRLNAFVRVLAVDLPAGGDTGD